MTKKKRVLLLILSLLIIIPLGLFVLSYFGVINNPLQNLQLIQQGPKVSVKTEYKNPFDKKTQYVNPFDTYKNPFVVSK